MSRSIILVALLLTFSAAATVGAQESEKEMQPITVNVPEGTFLFRNLRLVQRSYTGPEIKGEVVNNTNKDWSSVEFNLEALGADGKKIEHAFSSLDTMSFTSLKKGEAKPLEYVSFHFTGINTPAVSGINITFKDGSYPANYTFSLLKPAPSSELTFQDTFIDIAFAVTRSQLGFALRNKTDEPIKIDWNQVSYIDTAGDSHKVMHEGVKYIDRNSPQSPSVVPPTARLQDIVFPTDYVYYSEGRYGGWREEPLFPDGAAAAKYAGRTFSVFMPLEVNGKVKNYLFTFKIDKVES